MTSDFSSSFDFLFVLVSSSGGVLVEHCPPFTHTYTRTHTYLVLFAVNCVVSRIVNHHFTCGLITCASNWYRRALNA